MRSRTAWIVSAATAALVASVTSSSWAESTVTVHLRLDASLTAPLNEPAFVAACDVALPIGSNAKAALDAAACHDGVRYVLFACCGHFVDAIRGPGQAEATEGRDTFNPPCPGFVSYWTFLINGEPATVGIDAYVPADGDRLEFDYVVDEGCLFTYSLTTGLACFTAGACVDVDSPVPLSGPL